MLLPAILRLTLRHCWMLGDERSRTLNATYVALQKGVLRKEEGAA